MAKTKCKAMTIFAALLFAACLCLGACGGDMLATTEQARDEAQQESSAAAAASVATSELPAPAADEVAVIIDAANAAAYNGKFPDTLGAFIVAFEPGDTVYGALVKTGVDFEMRGRSYISSIGGIAEKACGPNSGWLYLVDGVQPTKNATDYELKGGETVLWAYTVTEGDVEGSVAMPDPAPADGGAADGGTGGADTSKEAAA